MEGKGDSSGAAAIEAPRAAADIGDASLGLLGGLWPPCALRPSSSFSSGMAIQCSPGDIWRLLSSASGVVGRMGELRDSFGLSGNGVEVSASKGAAVASQNYSYGQLLIPPWLRAVTEIAQNSGDAGSSELAIAFIELARPAGAAPLLPAAGNRLRMTYACDNGKGMSVDQYRDYFQSYGGSGKRGAGGGLSGGLGDGNTFTVHGADTTLACSRNFLSIIQGRVVVHLCAGCGFLLPRVQLRRWNDGFSSSSGSSGAAAAPSPPSSGSASPTGWYEVALPCVRAGCPLHCCDGMVPAAECPQACRATQMHPEMACLLARARAAMDGGAASWEAAAAADPALRLVCSSCRNFHARAEAPEAASAAAPPAGLRNGLELLIVHLPDTLAVYKTAPTAASALAAVHAQWLEHLPPVRRDRMTVHSAALQVDTDGSSYGFCWKGDLGERWTAAVGGAADSTLRARNCLLVDAAAAPEEQLLAVGMQRDGEAGGAGSGGSWWKRRVEVPVCQLPPPALTSEPVWTSSTITDKDGHRSWASLAYVTSSRARADPVGILVLMNGLAVHRMAEWHRPSGLFPAGATAVLNVYSDAHPSTYTTSNRGSLTGPLRKELDGFLRRARQPERTFMSVASLAAVLLAGAQEETQQAAAAAAAAPGPSAASKRPRKSLAGGSSAAAGSGGASDGSASAAGGTTQLGELLAATAGASSQLLRARADASREHSNALLSGLTAAWARSPLAQLLRDTEAALRLQACGMQVLDRNAWEQRVRQWEQQTQEADAGHGAAAAGGGAAGGGIFEVPDDDAAPSAPRLFALHPSGGFGAQVEAEGLRKALASRIVPRLLASILSEGAPPSAAGGAAGGGGGARRGKKAAAAAPPALPASALHGGQLLALLAAGSLADAALDACGNSNSLPPLLRCVLELRDKRATLAEQASSSAFSSGVFYEVKDGDSDSDEEEEEEEAAGGAAAPRSSSSSKGGLGLMSGGSAAAPQAGDAWLNPLHLVSGAAAQCESHAVYSSVDIYSWGTQNSKGGESLAAALLQQQAAASAAAPAKGSRAGGKGAAAAAAAAAAWPPVASLRRLLELPLKAGAASRGAGGSSSSSIAAAAAAAPAPNPLLALPWLPLVVAEGRVRSLPRAMTLGWSSLGVLFETASYSEALRMVRDAALLVPALRKLVPSDMSTGPLTVGILLHQCEDGAQAVHHGQCIEGACDNICLAVGSGSGGGAAAAASASSSSSLLASAGVDASALAGMGDADNNGHTLGCFARKGDDYCFTINARRAMVQRRRALQGLEGGTAAGAAAEAALSAHGSGVSFELAELDPEATVNFVLPLALHEMAHALAGVEHGHDERYAEVLTFLVAAGVAHGVEARMRSMTALLKRELEGACAQAAQLVNDAAAAGLLSGAVGGADAGDDGEDDDVVIVGKKGAKAGGKRGRGKEVVIDLTGS